ARFRGRSGVPRLAQGRGKRCAAAKSGIARVEEDGLYARRAIQPRRLWRRLRGAVAGRALVVPAVRAVGVGGQRDLLLDRRAHGVFLSGRGAHRHPYRPAQDDGVHAPALQCLPDPDPVHARAGLCDRAPVRSQCAIANGCAHPKLLCDGGRASCGARRGGQRHVGAAQPGLGRQSGPCRLPAGPVAVRLGFRRRRRHQDRLRPVAAGHVPQGASAGGAGTGYLTAAINCLTMSGMSSASSPVAPAQVKAVRGFNRFYTQRIGVLDPYLGSELSLTEVRVLYELAHRDQPTATELGRDLALDTGYLSRILGRFESRAWLARVPSPADARQSLLKLTEAGHQAFAPLQQKSRDEAAALLAGLSVPARDQLIGAMTAVRQLLDGAHQPAPTRTVVLRDPRPGDMGWVVQQHGEIYWREYRFNSEFEGLVAGVAAKYIKNFDPAWEKG